MPIRVTCRACGAAFKVDSKHAGKRGRCPQPGCEGTYVVPAADDSEELTALPTTRSSRRSAPAAAPIPARRRPAKAGSSKSRKSSGRGWLIGGGVAAVLLIAAAVVPFLGSGAGDPAAVAASSDAVVAGAAAPATPSAPDFHTQALPFIQKHCLECHGAEEPEAGISFANFRDEASMLKQRKLFERAHDLIQQGVMPPADAAQPTADEKAPVLAYLNRALFYVDCTAGVDPGRVTIRRLNRSEYNNTIRDLVGVNFQPAADFPADDVGYGFDNIGDVLSLPPLLMEKYVEAADTVARAALVVIDPAQPPVTVVNADKFVRGPANHDHDDAILIVSTGHVGTAFEAPLAGEYLIKVAAAGQRAGKDLPRLELRVDSKAVKTFDVEAKDRATKDHEHRVKLTRGQHQIVAAFTNDFYDEKNKADRNLLVRRFEIVGPVTVDADSYSGFQKSFLATRPAADVSVNVAVRNDLRPFLKKAFRRPVQETELDLYVKFVQQQMEQGESFPAAMQSTLMAVLVSPHFLFRVETDRNPEDPLDKHALNDYELASRLSYFLWSSLPDDRLFELAEKNELHRDEVLDAEVRRMLADPRSQALVDNFAEQWLQLRILNDLRPDPERFPEFGPDLRQDMQQETRQLFAHIMREDRSVLEFLDARYTFINERLAKHYGISGVSGPEFQQVSLEGTPRAGLLTHASVMTMTSNPNRTSPVKRGKWIMEVILNSAPPPPPPNVPELEASKAAEGLTFRQQMELHRQNASCASCHRVMDELGFGLENFDPIGRYRDKDGNTPLDVTGELPDGGRFSGPQELAGVLKQKQVEFSKSLSDKLLTYALGRGLEYYDRCTVNRISDNLAASQYRFSTLVSSIVKSEAFRMRRGEQVQAAP